MSRELPRIVEAEALPSHCVRLRYADGVVGEVDLSDLLEKEAFAPWRDESFFRSALVNHGRSLSWGEDIDLCADALYLKITGLKPEQLFPALRPRHVHA